MATQRRSEPAQKSIPCAEIEPRNDDGPPVVHRRRTRTVFGSPWTWSDTKWVPGRSKSDDQKLCDAYFVALHEDEDARLAKTGFSRDDAPEDVLRKLIAGESLRGIHKSKVDQPVGLRR